MYFHEFQIGFNAWYIVALVFLGTSAVSGYFGVELTEGHAKKSIGKRTYARVASLYSVIIGLMLLAESDDGIIQWFDNHLQATDSGVWSLVATPMTIALIAVVFGLVCYYLALAAQKANFRRLVHLRFQTPHQSQSQNTREGVADELYG